MNADDFILCLRDHLSKLVLDERTFLVEFEAGFSPGKGRGSVVVNFINLPTPRHKERRGGGAESENNRQLFFVNGFHATAAEPADRLVVEQLTNGIGRGADDWAPKMRKKTASPEKIAEYLAKYVNDIAARFEPNFTHE